MTHSLGAGTARVLALTTAAVLGGGVLAAGTTAASAANSAPKVIHYQGVHIVHTKATAQRFLKHTSPAFKRFAAKAGHAERVADVKNGDSKECIAHAGVSVLVYTRGYAFGEIGDCGGYAALWTNRTKGATGVTSWRQVFGSQDVLPCPVLRKYKVPSTIAGTKCLRPTNEKVVPYHQAWVAPSN